MPCANVERGRTDNDHALDRRSPCGADRVIQQRLAPEWGR
jgi:hypothetical protein